MIASPQGASASAPGKVILFGEHAVVYGRPAIAVPVSQVQAQATVSPQDSDLTIEALELGRTFTLGDAPESDPLAAAVQITLAHLGAPPPAAKLTVHSTIPIASGLGSGAAVTVAIVRALSGFLGVTLETPIVSRLAFEIEKIHHGTPSGIDNSVVAFCRPVYFVRSQPIETVSIPTPFRLLIADTGVASPTRETVGDVRLAWQANPQPHEALFDQIGQLADSARQAIERGKTKELGALMNENHLLLARLGVSSPLLERLIGVALTAGARGAKLSGGGRGGNLIAIAPPDVEKNVIEALISAGAVRVIATTVSGNG